MTTFYQLRNGHSCIMVEAVCIDLCYKLDTMYCIHSDTGGYFEMRSAKFNEFIKDYYEIVLTRERYKELFCKRKYLVVCGTGSNVSRSVEEMTEREAERRLKSMKRAYPIANITRVNW